MKNLKTLILSALVLLPVCLKAQVTFENEVKITDIALHFDGVKVSSETAPNSTTGYDYAFGSQISAHGDCIATYKQYVFMTWYKGGKENRNMMLTRYNTETGTQKTIEFPHKHTGWRNVWYIGETHNTIGIGVSPIDGTIHLLFDMHAYSRNRPSDGSLSNDYFRYSYSKKNAAEVSDEDFTLDQFVEDSGAGDYTYLSLNGIVDHDNFSEFTYPRFFMNGQGDLFFSMRKGSSPNGGYHFAKYDANTSSWSNFVKFADKNAKNYGQDYNWGMYGRFQFVGGKIAIGFQRRLQNTNDRYLYQNGFYFAYSDDPSGQTGWKNYKGEDFSTPLRDADKILAYEPGDLVETTQKDQVYMVSGFDWTITDRGDVHIIGSVRDDENNVTKKVHTYKKVGETEFTTSTDFTGGERLYTYANNVYMIGLNSSGRIAIQKSTGGTNNFQKVYEATSGRRFRGGRAYLNEGKIYYYTMDSSSSGDERSLYLQIIDLGLNQDPFRVSLTSPLKDNVYDLNKTLELSADAVNTNGSISKVEFLINNQAFGEDTTSPYAINWVPDTEGTFTIKAKAYNENNESVSSPEINIAVEKREANDLSGDIYKLKNLATGKYLTSSGSMITANDSKEGSDKDWQFVKAEVPGFDYYNIDSEVKGTIRFKGGSAGELVSTSFGAPNTAVDKIWTVIANTDGSYSFETRNLNRFLHHAENNSMIHSSTFNDRSKWIVESKTLNIDEIQIQIASIKIYPNPAKSNFTLVLNNIGNSEILIYNLLGKLVFSDKVNEKSVEIENQDKFKPGVYLIKVIASDSNKIYHTKLIIK